MQDLNTYLCKKRTWVRELICWLNIFENIIQFLSLGTVKILPGTTKEQNLGH